MRVVSLLALLLACGGSTPPVAEPVTPTPGALAASELVEASELPAALTVVLRPDRWSEVTETVARWIGTDPPGDLRALLSSRPEDLLRLESRRWHLAASELTHLDRSRPVVFRLFEPRVEGLAQVLEVVDGQRLPYRHVILLPSAQPEALLGELTSRVDCPPVAEGLQCDRHVVAFSAREGEVVVVVDGDGDGDGRSRRARGSSATPPRRSRSRCTQGRFARSAAARARARCIARCRVSIPSTTRS
ncbi:MAG: hypothetical protein R3B99_02805 [Polyangiales bacterium]